MPGVQNLNLILIFKETAPEKWRLPLSVQYDTLKCEVKIEK